MGLGGSDFLQASVIDSWSYLFRWSTARWGHPPGVIRPVNSTQQPAGFTISSPSR